MPIRGDFGKLAGLINGLGKLAGVPSQVAGKVAPKIAGFIKAEFAAGMDPYGRPWKPLKPATLARGRTPPPLDNTGDLKDTVDAKPMQGAGVSVTFGVPYAGFHQHGTKRMVARPILPANGLPRTWSEAIAQETRTAIKGAL